MADEMHCSPGNPFLDPSMSGGAETGATLYLDRNANLTLGQEGLIVHGRLPETLF